MVLAFCIIFNSISLTTSAHEMNPAYKTDFYKIFDENESIMIVVDPQTGSIEHVNKAAANFYGYSIEQLESMNITEINISSEKETKENMQNALNDDRNNFIFQHKLASGEIRTVEVYSCPHVLGDKEVLFSIIYDITEKTQLQTKNRIMTFAFLLIALGIIIFLYVNNKSLTKIKKEIENFNILRKTFTDSYEDLIYLKDENLKYIFANKAFCRFVAREETEINGREDTDFVDEDFADKLRITDLNVLERKTAIIDEFNWNNKTYKTTKFPVELGNGTYGVGAYIEDVTESHNNKRKIEKNLLRNQILVDVLSRNFETTQEQLDYVLNNSLTLTESKFGYIYLYDEESKEFLLNSWSKDVMAECTVVEKQTKYQLEKTGLWGEVVRQRKPIIVNNYEIPNAMKKGYPEGHIQLKKFMSTPVIIDNRIVAVVGLANKDSDYDSNDVYQITALMKGIWNAKERREAIADLAIERNKFLQTIISIGDGVLVVDLDGKVTMLNKVAEKLTGWSNKDAVGRHYKKVFILSCEDENCIINDPIEDVLNTDTVQELDSQAILISKDGIRYSLEDSAAPIKDDKNVTIGVVLVFRDITEKREQMRKIEYLSFHDALTGLYNRMFFEEELIRLDTERNLPISIIVGDMNGLKLTNDIFGHSEGDLLLQKAAEILQKVCRADDIIARVGGDEFTILLPKTGEDEARKIIARIREQFSKENVRAMKCSISLGCDTKKQVNEDIVQILNNAEKKMYFVKTLEREESRTNAIKTIIETLHKNNPREVEHSKSVSILCKEIGKAVGLSEVDIRRVKDAGFLHDIGKIILREEILNKDILAAQEQREMNQHPIIGFRILNSFDETLDLAELVLAHHENWDSSGYPKGLKGEEIPLLARIIAIAESYDSMMNRRGNNAMSNGDVIEEIKRQAGAKFDPELVSVFLKILE